VTRYEPARAGMHPARLTLRDLMTGIALLAVCLALAFQLVAIRRRAAELERWGQSLRQRERHLRQMDSSVKRAAPRSEDPLRHAADAPEAKSEVPPS